MNKSEFMKLISSARNAYVKAQTKEEQLFSKLGESFPELDLSCCNTNAENADNIEEAITCYLGYGEYSAEKIWDEICSAAVSKN